MVRAANPDIFTSGRFDPLAGTTGNAGGGRMNSVGHLNLAPIIRTKFWARIGVPIRSVIGGFGPKLPHIWILEDYPILTPYAR